MTEEERKKIREERLKRLKPGVAISSSQYAPCISDGYDNVYGVWYYYQISATHGLERYGHPEIEALISFHMNMGGSSIVSYLAECVKSGKRFMRGQRFEVPISNGSPWNCIVEFRPSSNGYGFCLRAVVLDLEEEYQSLPTDKAYEYIESLGSYDPYE